MYIVYIRVYKRSFAKNNYIISYTCDYYTSSHVLIHYAILNHILYYTTHLYTLYIPTRREGGYRQDPGHTREGQPIRVKGHRVAERQRTR